MESESGQFGLSLLPHLCHPSHRQEPATASDWEDVVPNGLN